MSFPKPQPPKSVLKPILSSGSPSQSEINGEKASAPKKPFVLKDHLTDRPFADIKAQLSALKTKF